MYVTSLGLSVGFFSAIVSFLGDNERGKGMQEPELISEFRRVYNR